MHKHIHIEDKPKNIIIWIDGEKNYADLRHNIPISSHLLTHSSMAK